MKIGLMTSVPQELWELTLADCSFANCRLTQESCWNNVAAKFIKHKQLGNCCDASLVYRLGHSLFMAVRCVQLAREVPKRCVNCNHYKTNSWNEFFDFNSSFGRQNEVDARLADFKLRPGIMVSPADSKSVNAF